MTGPTGPHPARTVPGPRERSVLAAICGVELRRLARDRTALFFFLVLPFLLILVLGTAFPADDDRQSVGVVVLDDGSVGDGVLAALQDTPTLEVTRYEDSRALGRDVQLGTLAAGVVLPAGLSEDVRRGGTGTVTVQLVPTDQSSGVVRSAVDAAVEQRAAVLTAARFAADRTGMDPTEALRVAEEQVPALAEGGVREVSVSRDVGVTASSFAFVAGAELVLFMFVNSLAGGASLVEMRTLGVASRALAAPVRVVDLIAGVSLARVVVALGQGVLIAAVAAVVFGVDWGDPLVVVAVVVVFAVVGAGAGVLTGALARTPDQAPAVGVPVALAMAALGGCFFPLSLAPEPMQVVARVVTPHAWAMSALSGSLFDGYGLGQVWVDLVVLAAWAVTLLAVGTLLLRRRLLSGR